MSDDENKRTKIIKFRTTGYNLEKMELSNTPTLVFNAEAEIETSDKTVKIIQGFAYTFEYLDAMIFVSDNVAYRIV
jgi:hypothetical protein